MSSPNTTRKSNLTPEQLARIEQNRKEALKRLEETRKRRAQEALNSSKPAENNGLTSEQKAKIEQNRMEALKRLEQSRKSKLLPTTSLLSANRMNPYSKPQNVSHAPPAKQKIVCRFELESANRFIVKHGGYDAEVNEIFKRMKSRNFVPAEKHWTFCLYEHNSLADSLRSLNHVELKSLPKFLIENMLKKFQQPGESCLKQIDDQLVSSLLEYQKEGIIFGISRNGRILLADDPGLGKSRQALGIADYYKNDWPLLIVTNASTRQFWGEQIIELLPKVLYNDIYIMQNQVDYLGTEKIIICSYNNLQGDIQNLQKKKFGVMIFDESHNLKSPNSKQTKNAKILAKMAKRILLLSGTPSLSRPVELFSQIELIDEKFVSFMDFTKRYCNGHDDTFSYNVSGATNLKELNILLSHAIMIRRIKDDVFRELSPKYREIVFLKDFEKSTEKDKELEEYIANYQKNDQMIIKQEEKLLFWFQKTAEKKVDAACAFVKDFIMRNDEKILVFAIHHIIMNGLEAQLQQMKIPFIKIDGSVRGEVRAERVAQFQNDSRIRVAILSIRACNAGITLTLASSIIFCELDWNPSAIIQAEGRAHRIGQENKVKVYYLIAPKTADELLWITLNRKQEKLAKAGLFADAENLSENTKISNFNVKNMMYTPPFEQSSTVPKSSNCNNNYLDDDELDEETLKFIENLP